jgi:hypothetical protein
MTADVKRQMQTGRSALSVIRIDQICVMQLDGNVAQLPGMLAKALQLSGCVPQRARPDEVMG